jgi:mannose-6-phosphate isomerase-like protein (cupin superfamily)
VKLETDHMINRPVEDVKFDLSSRDDYQELRKLWTTLPKIPKLVDGSECPIILDTGGQIIRSLLKGEESAGALMVAMVTLAAGADGAPNHHQPLEDEFWFALQGEWEWTVGSRRSHAAERSADRGCPWRLP